jgi:hypothetical protein
MLISLLARIYISENHRHERLILWLLQLILKLKNHLGKNAIIGSKIFCMVTSASDLDCNVKIGFFGYLFIILIITCFDEL